ncbi:MAG TPA: hypothetical protein DCS45_15995 [Roseovarius nubinhibens]|uniref:Uncharacterized protein n=1 Tax=Roseovarius nubinhibens TaxID=314263 RepID=A0A348WFP5_9RHOB|nr:hypothetical protein [Roseovarius nubinhibens]|tara:strand:- start:15730 stop:16143 length:414 start_codon:yes stop_codon:yes gene_type:complete
MTKIIDHSFGKGQPALSTSMMGRVRIKVITGFFGSSKLGEEDFVSVSEIDEDKYRSAGGAAAGAIIGGVLTGGIGFLAGAAIGGRRRTESSYLIVLKDGGHVALRTKDKVLRARLGHLAQNEKIATMVAERGGSAEV